MTPEKQKYARNQSRRWRATNREKLNKYHVERRHKKRDEVIEFLGGKCVKCGFSDKRALQIDHVHGDGIIEWKGIHYDKRHEMIRENPQNYQLLCANCNWIKRHECDERPFKNRPGKRWENHVHLVAPDP